VVGVLRTPAALLQVGKGQSKRRFRSQGSRARLDAAAGREEVLSRRVGGNELDAIDVCRGLWRRRNTAELHVTVICASVRAAIISSTPGARRAVLKNGDGTDGGPGRRSGGQSDRRGLSVPPSAFHGYISMC
jgi:hypothetical protein